MKKITLEELARHNGAESGGVWIAVQNGVYDVTGFLDAHPGGRAILEDPTVAGRDVSRQFKMFHEDSVLKKLAQKFKIGELVEGDGEGKGGAITLVPSQLEGLAAVTGGQPTLVPSNRASRTSGGTSHLLPAERAKASFDVQKMTAALYGGEEAAKRRRFILHPTAVTDLGYKKYDMSREELMERSITDFVGIHKPFTLEGYRPGPNEVSWMSEAATNTGGMMPHYGLFLPTILGQASDAQVAAWLPRALTFRIVGSYAQTELAHGSNVRGLQTVAEWNQAKKCFILNTPSLGATKWWNSNAGIIATHAAVYAQLVMHGKEMGVHVFFVQLRDENHNFLPGILCGDVGVKLGDAGLDTSWIQFTNVEVPREHLFAKRQHVDASGNYVKHGREKGGEQAHYLTMMQARSGMASIAAGKLSIAATIAVRYSCVRHQGFVDTSAATSFTSRENAVIEYQTQRYRLLKQVANSYAMRATGTWLGGVMDKLRESAFSSKGTITEDMPEIHATSAGLKGLVTKLTADGIEDLRKCCGGHGYLLNSGVAMLAADYVWQVSAEGDFIVMLLQTGRYLLKSVHAARKGEKLAGLTECLAPLKDPGFDPSRHAKPAPAKSAAQARDLDHTLSLFRYRTLVSCDRVARMFDAQMSRPGAHFEEAFNNCALALVSTAQSHCYYFMLRNFVEVIRSQSDPDVARAQTRLCALFGLGEVLDGKQWAGLLDSNEYVLVERAVMELLDELRPDAVALVDAFDWSDTVLNSTLGRYDGNVYEALFAAAFNAPLNTGKPFRGYEELRKSLDIDFLKLRNKPCEEIREEDEPSLAAVGGGAAAAKL